MFVTSTVQQAQVGRESDRVPQLLNPQVSAAKGPCAVARVRGFDQRLERVQGDRLDAIAKRELVASREFLDRREKPQEELIIRLPGDWLGAPRAPPLPLWGRAGVGGRTALCDLAFRSGTTGKYGATPSLTLPTRGEGTRSANYDKSYSSGNSIMRLERRTPALRIVRHCHARKKNSTRGFAPGPQEVRRSRLKG